MDCNYADLSCLIGSDFVSNIISIASLLLGFMTLYCGVRQVNKYIEYKRGAQAEAPFGYHKHLSVFIKRFKRLITDKEDEPYFAMWYFLSEELQESAIPKAKEKAYYLRDVSIKFLEYLSNTPKQVPPLSCNEKEWNDNMDKLEEHLIRFSVIGDFSFPIYETKKEIKGAYTTLIEALDWILEKIGEPASSNPAE